MSSTETVKEKPLFYIDMVGFAKYGSHVEVTLAVDPNFSVKGVVEMLHDADSNKVIQLTFLPTKQKYGRRGYSLQQEWEQLPQGQTQLKERI